MQIDERAAFEAWIGLAYRQPQENYSVHNMEVAFAAGAAFQAQQWRGINTLPTCDDFIWLYCQNTKTIEGPVTPNPIYEEFWTHWAYAKAPSTCSLDARPTAPAAKEPTE